MEERVARAMFSTYLPDCDPDLINRATRQPNWMQKLDEARAGIRAMREPTNGMIDAGGPNVADENGVWWSYKMVPAWKAMIDAATSPER